MPPQDPGPGKTKEDIDPVCEMDPALQIVPEQGGKFEGLDEYVQDQTVNNDVPMWEVLKKYPYIEETGEQFYTDEEAEKEDEEEDMKVYQEKLN